MPIVFSWPTASFTAGRWADAAAHLPELTVAAPRWAALARYGACLHNLGIFDDAVRGLHAAPRNRPQPGGCTTWPVPWPRAGRQEEALDWLRKPRRTASHNAAAVETDDDLASRSPTRAGTKSDRLRQAGAAVRLRRALPPARLLARGWEREDRPGATAGTSQVEMILNQSHRFENWTGFSGMSGKSFISSNPAPVCGQTWVDDKGDAHDTAANSSTARCATAVRSKAADGHWC
jgi:hypothetical protein